MSKIDTPTHITYLPLAVIKNMISLSTAGFGFVVALAWNEVIRNSVSTYIDPYLGKNSGIVSLLIYAVIMTILAVLVTMQLSSIEKRLEAINERIIQKAITDRNRRREEKKEKREKKKK